MTGGSVGLACRGWRVRGAQTTTWNAQGRGGVCRAAPCTRRGNGNSRSNSSSRSNSNSGLSVGWRGGSGCGGRCKYVHVARSPHPCGSRPRNRTHPAFDSFPRSVGNALGVRSVFRRKTDLTPFLLSISDRYVDQGRHLPTAAGICRRRGTVGLRGVSRMDAATKPPWTGLRRPRKPTVPRHPADSPLLLLLWLLHSLRQVQGAALPNPLKCLWEPARTARRSAC